MLGSPLCDHPFCYSSNLYLSVLAKMVICLSLKFGSIVEPLMYRMSLNFPFMVLNYCYHAISIIVISSMLMIKVLIVFFCSLTYDISILISSMLAGNDMLLLHVCRVHQRQRCPLDLFLFPLVYLNSSS